MIAIGAAFTAACSSAKATTTTTKGRCQLADRDSVFLSAGPVFRDCAVDRPAKSVRLTNTDYRPTPSRTTCYSADLEFVVDVVGMPETRTARVIRTNDQAFAEAVLASLSAWNYDPAVRGGTPVRQIVTEHRVMSAMIVTVPAGSGPPSRGSVRPPNC